MTGETANGTSTMAFRARRPMKCRSRTRTKATAVPKTPFKTTAKTVRYAVIASAWTTSGARRAVMNGPSPVPNAFQRSWSTGARRSAPT